MPLFRPLDSDATARFYDDLATGNEARSLWGMEKRFSPEVALQSPSFQSYFVETIRGHLGSEARLLDLGCGTGMYHPLLAPLCGTLTGVELSEKSAELARQNAERYGLGNVVLSVQDSSSLALRDDSFDAAICLDLLHHVFDLEATLAELSRVVKPGGDLLIFEPNCLNPALLLMCVLDRNEWGAAQRAYSWKYRRAFSESFELVSWEYNGLLIGPQGKLSLALVELMLATPLSPLLRFFSPKLFFHLRNRERG